MAVKRVTVNLPAELLQAAQATTGRGVTETLVQGLELLRRSGAGQKARRLRGKLKLEVDLEVSRERARH